MPDGRKEALEMFCAALEMKEKKKALYEDALNACVDEVGKETFRMLRDAEKEHGEHIRRIYEEMKKGSDWADACRYYPEATRDIAVAFTEVAKQYGKDSEVCTTYVGAIDTGMQLENAAVKFFQERLKRAQDPEEQRFLEQMVADEKTHFIALADLKFYYSDPQGWYLEKSRSTLDGAGPMA